MRPRTAAAALALYYIFTPRATHRILQSSDLSHRTATHFPPPVSSFSPEMVGLT